MSICPYNDCVSVYKPVSRLAFFVLPQDHRRQTWILNSGNSDLLELSATAKRYFCELHFRECDIRRQFNRCILRRDAVPLPYKTSASTNGEPANALNRAKNALKRSKPDDELVAIDMILPGIENDDLIVTDYEDSSRISSSLAPSSPAGPEPENDNDHYYNEDVMVELDEYLNDSSAAEEDETKTTYSSSPTIQSSSLVSNVIMIDEATPGTDHQINNVFSTEPLGDTKSISQVTQHRQNKPELVTSSSQSEITYPTNRAKLRRRRLRLVKQQELRRLRIAAKKPRQKKPVQTAQLARRDGTPEISLEAVAGRTEDTYFALSLVGSLERLSSRKRAQAKLHILQYLTELAFAE